MCTKIIPITGISGSGKSSVAGGLISHSSNRVICASSIATRPPRNSDFLSPKKYINVDKGVFDFMVEKDFFFEYEVVNGDLYGTPLIFFEAAKKLKRNLILDIDVKGAMRLLDKKSEGHKILKDVEILPVFLWRNISPNNFDEKRDREAIKNQIKKSFEKRGDTLTDKDLITRTDTALKEYLIVIEHHEIFTYVENVENNLTSTVELFESVFF